MENVKKFKAAINRSFSSRGGILAHRMSGYGLIKPLHNGENARICLKRRKGDGCSLVIRRQPNFRLVNALEEFVDEDDPLAIETKVDNFDNAVYILNEKLQAVTPEVF